MLRIFLSTIFFVCFLNIMLPRGMAQVIGHDQPYTSAELGNSSVQDAGFERHLNISIYDDSVFKEAYCAGDPGSQWGVESGYKGQRNVHFMGIQFANIKAKEYYPNFFGIAGWNGTGGGTNNDYRWVVDTIYEVVCNGKCHGEHNVEVTIGYDLTNDPDGIKDLFGELLHKDCPCENDHTVDWSQVNWNQEGTYNVKCNHPDKCPKLGTVKVVDIDFEIKLVPNDRNFPTRSYSRLGLQESGHIEVIPKGNDTPVKSEYTAIVDPGGTHLQIDASGDSVWNIPAHPNAVWIYDFNATFDPGVAKIKVTRTRNGVSKVKTYTVSIIQPNDINYSKDTSYGDQKISTPIPRFGVEGRANLFILPNDVSFSALSIGEHSGRYSTSGCFYQDILENPNYALHRVGAPIPLIAPTTGEGTPNHPNYRDTIRAQTSHSGAGIVSIKIPTYYVSQSQNTSKKTFATVSFEGVISTNGFIRTIIVTKQNAQFTVVEKIQP